MEYVMMKAAIGRANCVLLFEKGTEKVAIVTQLTANISNPSQSVRLCFKGELKVSKKTLIHLTDVVLPITDNILDILGLANNNFELSITNLGAFSSQNIGSTVSGNSMDLPFLLAVLSSSLQMPINENFISTGYISSLNGGISMVYGLPEKFKAAEKESHIQFFIHPDIESDSSLERLTPNEKRRIEGAHAKSKRNLRSFSVKNIFNAIGQTFSDEHIVLSSLRNGFFETDIQGWNKPESLVKVARYFSENNEKRLWSSLERQLIHGRCDDAKELLLSYVKYKIGRRYYPDGFGKKLFNLIASLPPNSRKNKLKFPLLPILDCINLCQFATEDDQDDVILLFNVCTGEKFKGLSSVDIIEDVSDKQTTLPGSDLLETILSKISVDTLTKKIIGPIDSARACYLLESTTVESAEEFNHTIVSFYTHLLRHTRRTSGSIDYDAAGNGAISILNFAFSDKGGRKAALAEATHGHHGGLKLVLDTITRAFKQQEQEEHINYILSSILDPLDWKRKIDLINALLKRLKNHLPIDITLQPAENYVENCETLVKLYVNSMDDITYIFKSL